MKKLLSILITLAMLMTSMGSLVAFAEEGTTTDETETAIPISTVAEFEAMSNGNYYLTQDIDFEGKVYTGNYIVKNLIGKLDGKGHKIYNFSFNSTVGGDTGLFQYLAQGGDATVENLVIGTPDEKIRFDVTTNVYTIVGGLVAAHGTNGTDLQIKNVKMYADIHVIQTANLEVNVGGFIGHAQKTTLTNCDFYGSIEVDSVSTSKRTVAAGFCAWTKNQRATIQNSRNYADVTVHENGTRLMLAGFIAFNNFPADIINCVNFGDVKTVSGTKTGGTFTFGDAGAFFGYMNGEEATTADGKNVWYYDNDVIGCTNFGNVYAPLHAGIFYGYLAMIAGRCANNVNYGQVASAGTAGVAYGAVKNDNVAKFYPNAGTNIDKSTENAFDYETSTSVKFAGVQDTDPANDLFNVRFLSVVDGLDYTSVGYEISAYCQDSTGVIYEWTYSHDTQRVYDKVIGTKDDGTPFEMDAKEVGKSDAYQYIYALATTEVPATASVGNVVFVVKPFAKTTAGTVYGASAICVYNSGVCESVTYAN